MSRTEKIELTNLCLIRRGEYILLQNRVKKDWHGYALPGGHVEPGESIVASVIREIQEETGLTVNEPKLCGVKQFPLDDGGRYLVMLFRADRFTGALKASEEGSVEWIRRDQIGSLNTVADLEQLLQVMERDDLTEFQYTVSEDDWIVHLY